MRASTAGFLNWLCDSNSSIQKGTDRIDGGNFDTDLNNVINGQYGFSRVTDTTPEVAINSQTPADNVPLGAPNGSCAANLTIAAGGITASNAVITFASNVPAHRQGWMGSERSAVVLGVDPGWYHGCGPGPQPQPDHPDAAPAVGVVGNPTPTNLYFPGQAPVLQVNTLGS